MPGLAAKTDHIGVPGLLRVPYCALFQAKKADIAAKAANFKRHLLLY
jgi:hypothetical protein